MRVVGFSIQSCCNLSQSAGSMVISTKIGCDDGNRMAPVRDFGVSHWSAPASEATMGIGVGECSLPATGSVLAHVIGRDHKPSKPVTSRTTDKTISLTCSH